MTRLFSSTLFINVGILAIVTTLTIAVNNNYDMPFPVTLPLLSVFTGVQLGTAFSKRKTGLIAIGYYLGGLIFGALLCLLFFYAISR